MLRAGAAEIDSAAPAPFCRFFTHIAENEHSMRKALAAGFEWALLESIEGYVGSKAILHVSDVDMSRFEDTHLRQFAAGGYLHVLDSWLVGGMVETPQEMGELTETMPVCCWVPPSRRTSIVVPEQIVVGISSELIGV